MTNTVVGKLLGIPVVETDALGEGNFVLGDLSAYAPPTRVRWMDMVFIIPAGYRYAMCGFGVDGAPAVMLSNDRENWTAAETE